MSEELGVKMISAMKKIQKVTMTMALLMVALSMSAEKYTGTIERFGEKMKYTIDGGTVTSKEGPWLPPTDFIRSPNVTALGIVRMDVEPGETIRLTAERVKGTSEWYKKCEVHFDEIMVAGEGKAEYYIKVPDNKETIIGKVIYYGRNSALEYNIVYTVKKKVNTATDTYRGKADVAIAFEDPDGYVNYTITGRNFRKVGNSSTELEADYFVGEKVTVTCDGTTVSAGAPYESYISYDGDEKRQMKGSVQATYTIHRDGDSDQGRNTIQIGCCMNELSPGSFQNCGGVTVHVNIIDPGSTFVRPPVSTIKWDNVVYDNNCPICGSEYSEFDPNGYSVGASYSCTKDPDDTRFEIIPGKVIFGNTRIRTEEEELGIDYGDQEKAIIIEKNSEVEFTNDHGVPIWTVIKGGIRGINLKPLKGSGGSFLFYTPHIKAVPFGTVFVIQNYGNSSRVYLLSGSMEVTSKKTGKKVTLKPGQASTVSADGQQKVQQFDIKKAAKKFGISDAALQGQVTTTAATKRYELERAIVKYKVTQGNQQGAMAKAFDQYGRNERRELRMGDQTSIALTQGSISYALDKNKKIAKRTKDADLNFLDFTTPIMKKLNLQKKGTATVMGKTCTLYTGKNVEYYVWKGLVLKKVQKEKNGSTTIHEATSIEEPTSIDATMFKLPNGYTVK